MRFSSEMRKFESDIFSSFQGGLGYNFDFPFFVPACLCQCDSRVRLRVGGGRWPRSYVRLFFEKKASAVDSE